MASNLTGLITPLTDAADAVVGDLTMIQGQISQLNTSINPQGSNSVSQLIQQNGDSLDFSGLGAQAFQEAVKVHMEVTDQFTSAFSNMTKALNTLATAVFQANGQYDSQLATIKATDYAPSTPWDNITQGASVAFIELNPAVVMIDDVIASANGNAVLLDGSSDLMNLLSSAYVRLADRADSEHIPIPPDGSKPVTPADQAAARQMVVGALYALYYDISQAYTGWGTAVQGAFQTFKSALSVVEQQVQPYIDLLTQPSSAASIFDMIEMISQSNEPIAIVQNGPNSIMVLISGTNLGNFGYDTNLWNALGTGMGQDMPYEQDVIDAINQYCQEHGLTNPEVTLAGHSLGGMVAQQIAEKGLFDVRQVVTFGSPIMGPPAPGVDYNIYEADSDLVPLLSRYENSSLPASLQDLAKMFPAQLRTKFGWNPFTDARTIIQDGIGINQDAKGVGYVLSEVMALSPYMSPTDQKTLMNMKLGPVTVKQATGLFSNFKMQPYAGNQAKLDFMDQNGDYQGQLQRVPDLPESLGLKVHSDYGQSKWLANQQIFWNMDAPSSGFLNNVQYFGMPNEYQTAQINQYMHQHSTLGEFLPLK